MFKHGIVRSAKQILAAMVSILVFLGIWYLSTNGTNLGRLMPTPDIVLKSFIRSFTYNIGSYTIIGHVAWSLSRALTAYVLGSAAGITLGLTMGWYPKVEAIFRPWFEIIRPIPPIAWIPLSILWFGLGEVTKLFIIFLAVFSNVTINAYAGAKAVDQTLVGAARMLGANDRQLFTTVVIPFSVPYIFAGLQIALSSGWAVVVAAEMVRSSEGIGWLIISGMEMNNTTRILVGIIAIGIVGYLLAAFMRGVEKKLCAWNQRGQ